MPVLLFHAISSTCTALVVALILSVKAIWPRILPQQDLFLLCCQGTGVYLRLNSCRLKRSPLPTARNHKIIPCWMDALLLLHHCLPTLRVFTTQQSPLKWAESLEGSINSSSVILHRRAVHFLASTVLLVLFNRRKAWSNRVLFMLSFYFLVWTAAPRNMYVQCEQNTWLVQMGSQTSWLTHVPKTCGLP